MRSSLYSRIPGALAASILALVCMAQTMAGYAYTALPDDRVLTFNDDINAACPVSGQGMLGGRWYADNNANTEDEDDPLWLETTQYNLIDGTTNWTLTNDTGKAVWTLKDVRLGNVFDRTGNALGSTHNYLPWKTSTAVDYRSHEAPFNQKGAGQATMRNTTDSMIVSPLYAEGIGRIYFDAVNFTVGVENKVVVQVSEKNEPAESDWTNALVDVYAYTNGVYEAEMSERGVTEATLKMDIGGSTNNFYRVVLNESFANRRGKDRLRRFRIKRGDVKGSGEETEGMVIVDNIICSYPAMTAEIVPQGDYESNRAGESVLGYWGGLKEDDEDSLPYFGGALRPQADVVAVTNSAVHNATVTVSDAKCHYRWRYLTQQVQGVTVEGVNDSSANSAINKVLTGATLNLPVDGDSFKNMPAKVSAIVLGNNGVSTVGEIQYLAVDVDGKQVMSDRMKWNTAIDAPVKHSDNSWKQRFEFSEPPEVRMGRDYDVIFYDASTNRITQANGVRMVATDGRWALKGKGSDVSDSQANLLAQVEYGFDGGFKSMAMTATGSRLSGETTIDSEYCALPGDVEMYYTAEVDAPYYRWLNFSGVGTGGVSEISEKITAVTSRLGAAENSLPSCGTDYFVRLRDGRSALKDFVIEVTNTTSGAQATFKTSYVGDDWEWHALLYTVTNGLELGTCDLRFMTVSANNVTNYLNIANWDEEYHEHWNSSESAYKNCRWPMTLSAGNAKWSYDSRDSAWIKNVPFDGTTSYLRFRYLEADDGGQLVVTRADFQDFNGWNDANKNNTNEMFVSTWTANGLTGVSNKQQSYNTKFEVWGATDAETWSLTFPTSQTTNHYNVGETFANDTLLGWDIGKGKYVKKQYDVLGDHLALQMFGKGEGYLKYAADNRFAPNGIEEVHFKARMAQAMEFDKFAYFLGGCGLGGLTEISNYTFSVRGAMNYNNASGYDGQASMSLVANYNPNKGCYEFRVTQTNNGKSYKLDLLKWTKTPSGIISVTNLVSHTQSYDRSMDAGTSELFPAMFISVSNIVVTGTSTEAVHITAGLQKESGDSKYSLSTDESGRTYRCLIYNDTQADRIKTGSFGMASANCFGYFAKPTYYPRGAKLAHDRYEWADQGDKSLTTVAFSDASAMEMYPSIENEDWFFGGWMKPYSISTTNRGLRCSPTISQQVILHLSGLDNKFDTVGSCDVTGFALNDYTFQLYNTDKRWINLAVGGGNSDPIQTDVVICDVGMTQWRGENSDSPHQLDVIPTGYVSYSGTNIGGLTNILFTSGWVHEESGKKTLELNASRAFYDATAGTNEVVSVRSPLFDGESYYSGTAQIKRGFGLGMVAFSYDECDTNVNLLVQIAVDSADNPVTALEFEDLTKAGESDAGWVTVTNFCASAAGVEGLPLERSGVASYYIGMHSVTGAVRVVMDPNVIAKAQTGDNKLDPKFGRIVIKEVEFRDEPGIDEMAWTGWNLRTGNFLHEYGDGLLQYLADGAPVELDKYGQSVALNNSITDKIFTNETSAAFSAHQPYVQTPTFAKLDESEGAANAEVGEIRFKARRYDTSDCSARIVLYGYRSGSITTDSNWEYLAHFDIDSQVYTNFVHQLRPGEDYRAFRLSVKGVEGVTAQMEGGTAREPVVRVAFDNVLVAETLNPKVKFADVMAFYSDLNGLDKFDYANAKREQPLTKEPWGVQVEILPAQLGEEIDWSAGVEVTLYWHTWDPASLGTMDEQGEAWQGTTNWVNKAVLSRCTDSVAEGRYIYRSSYQGDPDSIVPANYTRGQVMQYHLTAKYRLKQSSTEEAAEEIVQEMDAIGEWVRPYWYMGSADYNQLYKKYGNGSAYTILDNVAPGNAWINEVNVFGLSDDDTGRYTDGFENSDYTNQYIEVAIPASEDIEGWRLQFLTKDGAVYEEAVTFSDMYDNDGYVSASKDSIPADGYVFLVAASPATKSAKTLSKADGQIDGTWRVDDDGDDTLRGGVYDATFMPLAVQLVRSTGIIEHQITLGGTNYYENYDAELAYDYSPAALADNLRAEAAARGEVSEWLSIGYDNGGLEKSLSVTNGSGSVDTDWTNVQLAKTPGERNGNQTLPTLHTSVGDLVVFTCYVGTNDTDAATGRLLQSDGGEPTTARLTLVVEKDWDGYAYLIYTVTNWYEIADVTTNKTGDAAKGSIKDQLTAGPAANQWTLPLGHQMPGGSSIEVRAWVKPWSKLTEPVEDGGYGLTDENPYTDAVMDWLENGTLLNGNKFANAGTDITLSNFAEYNAGLVTGTAEMTLTEMYVLDMDPTATDNMWFTMGLHALDPDGDGGSGSVLGKARLTYFAAISNDTTKVAAPPKAMRGTMPGSCSTNESDVALWDGKVFKIKGKLNSGRVNSQWVPIYHFLFGEDSFEADSTKPTYCMATVEIADQHEDGTPGAYEGFNEDMFSATGVFFDWTLNEELGRPEAPMILQKETFFTTP